MSCLKKWTIEGNYVLLEYDDDDSFFITKDDFDRAFGPIVSGSKEQILLDFGLVD